MENVDYNEWVPMGTLVKGLVLMITALLVFITITILFFGGTTVDSLFAVALNLGVFTFIMLLFWNYRGLRIQIIGYKLTVVYGIFNKKSFLLKELTYCKKTKANLGRYFGIGIRYGTDGSIAYTTSFVEAVEVATKNGKVFVFSSNNSDQICKTIKIPR